MKDVRERLAPCDVCPRSTLVYAEDQRGSRLGQAWLGKWKLEYYVVNDGTGIFRKPKKVVPVAEEAVRYYFT